MSSKLPYLEYSLSNLPGEIWKSVTGFNDFYEVSNLGRVKSVDRYVQHLRHGQQFVKGRILRQKVIKHRNILTGIPSIDLQVSLSLEAKMYFLNVRRIVYSAFIKELNYEADGLYVINKNGNGYNCSVSNLKLVNKSEKSKRAFRRNRVVESYLKYADRSTWENSGGATRRKPVVQYNLKGKIIGRFSSITEASGKTGIGEKEIIGVAKGKYSQWKGSIWKYARK